MEDENEKYSSDVAYLKSQKLETSICLDALKQIIIKQNHETQDWINLKEILQEFVNFFCWIITLCSSVFLKIQTRK